MTSRFNSPICADLRGFLQFKRTLGYRYARAEFALLEFDRFLQEYAAQDPGWRLDQAVLAWLASKPQRKAISVGSDAAVLRQFYSYLHRLPGSSPVHEPHWPQLPTESVFIPYVLSDNEVQRLLELAARLDRPPFRAFLYRALLLLLYCTGLRFGEALRLRLSDVDTRACVLFVETFKGRARWVPFHRSLSRELDKYLAARRGFALSRPQDRFLWVRTSRRCLSALQA